MSDPLFSEASTTTTARHSPLMMRFLQRESDCGTGAAPGGNSLITMPPVWQSAVASARCSRRVGHVQRRSQARRRSGPPPSRAPRWAAPSMPRARPLTTMRPASAELRPRRRATPAPAGVARARPDDGNGGRPRRHRPSPRAPQDDGRIRNVRSSGGIRRVEALMRTSIAERLALASAARAPACAASSAAVSRSAPNALTMRASHRRARPASRRPLGSGQLLEQARPPRCPSPAAAATAPPGLAASAVGRCPDLVTAAYARAVPMPRRCQPTRTTVRSPSSCRFRSSDRQPSCRFCQSPSAKNRVRAATVRGYIWRRKPHALPTLARVLLVARWSASPRRRSPTSDRTPRRRWTSASPSRSGASGKKPPYRWEQATEVDPTYAAAWNNLGIGYEQLGRFDDARKAYEKALELDPSNTFIRNNYDLFREIYDRQNRRRDR